MPAPTLALKVCRGMLCGHHGRETDQNRVTVEVYDDGNASSCEQRENTVAIEKIAETYVAAGDRDIQRRNAHVSE
jgi:hypothetical protein